MLNNCSALESSWNHPPHSPSLEKLSSLKPVPDARKNGDHWQGTELMTVISVLSESDGAVVGPLQRPADQRARQKEVKFPSPPQTSAIWVPLSSLFYISISLYYYLSVFWALASLQWAWDMNYMRNTRKNIGRDVEKTQEVMVEVRVLRGDVSIAPREVTLLTQGGGQASWRGWQVALLGIRLWRKTFEICRCTGYEEWERSRVLLGLCVEQLEGWAVFHWNEENWGWSRDGKRGRRMHHWMCYIWDVRFPPQRKGTSAGQWRHSSWSYNPETPTETTLKTTIPLISV